MTAVFIVSIVMGFGWNLIAMYIMGGKPANALSLGFAGGGVVAGAFAGWYTVWSRRRSEGAETFFHGISNYYLAIVVYWAGIVVLERIRMCIQYGGWTSFDLHDQLILVFWFVVLGTFPYGLILIPLGFASRHVVWKIYTRS